MDISTWLHGLGMQQYAQAFRDHAIDAEVLLELTTDDLKDLGVNPECLHSPGARAGEP